MKSKILGLLAVGLLAGPMAANAVQVTLGPNTYAVTTTVGTFDFLYATLSAQPWWDSPSLAVSAVGQVTNALGTPNILFGYSAGPLAAYSGSISTNYMAAVWTTSGVGGVAAFTCSASGCTTNEYTWLIIEAVPEPGTLALLGLGLAGLGVSRRRKAN